MIVCRGEDLRIILRVIDGRAWEGTFPRINGRHPGKRNAYIPGPTVCKGLSSSDTRGPLRREGSVSENTFGVQMLMCGFRKLLNILLECRKDVLVA